MGLGSVLGKKRRQSASGGARYYVLLHHMPLLLALAGLAGCTDDGAGSILVDPGRYSAYHCNDLATRAKELAARERDLRELIERANQGGGSGAVIGSLAYRTDYESVRSEEKLLQREAAEKNCNAAPQFQSDQTIR